MRQEPPDHGYSFTLPSLGDCQLAMPVALLYARPPCLSMPIHLVKAKTAHSCKVGAPGCSKGAALQAIIHWDFSQQPLSTTAPSVLKGKLTVHHISLLPSWTE